MKLFSRKTLITLAIILVIVVIPVWWLMRGDTAEYSTLETSGPKPVFDTPRAETFPTINVAEAVGWPKNGAPTAAKGLKVERFAADLDHPRSMLTLPNGDVLVTETNSPPRENKGAEGFVMKYLMGKAGAGGASPNRVVLLRDANQDGVAEQRHVLIGKGLNSPFGLALVGDKLFVANTDSLMAFPFTPGMTSITAKGEKLADLPSTLPNNHWTRGLLASADESLLYISVGSASNIAEHGIEVEKNRAAILEYNIETGKLRRHAAGLRNPVGMDLNPDTGELWTVVNERDMLGSDLVPDYLTSVPFASQFGWPWLYWRKNYDDRVEPVMPRYLQEYTKRPDYALGSHVAPLGLAFSRKDTALGPQFARGAFVALHGSWNRKPAAGYSVIFVPFKDNGLPIANVYEPENIKQGLPVDILTGFLSDGKALGRPAMLAFDQSGALLVSDDVGGIIWRVSAAQ